MYEFHIWIFNIRKESLNKREDRTFFNEHIVNLNIIVSETIEIMPMM